MSAVLTALLTSLCVALVAVPLVIRAATRLGVVDAPDARRKLHGRIVPLGGGLAVFCGWAAALAYLTWFTHTGAGPGGAFRFYGLAAGCALLAAIGIWDDWKELRGRQKLAGQAVAVLVVIASGTVVERVAAFGYTLDLGPLAWPFTAFWLLGAINAVNLLDGIDGLASTVGVILGTAFCALALLSPGGAPVAATAAALVGGLLAFLFYNFPPAKVFLGDAGSMLIGLVLGFVALHAQFKEAATMALAAPAAVWAIPIFDVLMAIVRRKLTGRSIYTTDRGHLHHRLVAEWGLSIPRVLLLVAAFCAATSAGAVASVVLSNEWVAVAVTAFTLAVMVGTKTFGRAECGLLARRTGGAALSLVPGTKRKDGAAHALRDCSEELKARHLSRGGKHAMSRLMGEHQWEELWLRLLEQCDRYHLTSVYLDVNHPALREDFTAKWVSDAPADPRQSWRTDLPVLCNGQTVGWLRVVAEHTGDRATDRIADLMATLAEFEKELVDLLETVLPARRSAAAVVAAAPPAPEEPRFPSRGGRGVKTPPLSSSSMATRGALRRSPAGV